MGLFFDNSAYPHIRPVLCDVQVGEGAVGGVVEGSIESFYVKVFWFRFRNKTNN